MRYAGGFASSDINRRIEIALYQQARRQEVAKAAGETVSKAGITTSTGITAYNLEAPTVGLVATRTPFLDLVPRRTTHRGDLGVHWKSLTALDSAAPVAIGVQEGQRNASIAPTVVPSQALFKTLGLEDDYTFESEEAAESFDNVPQRSVQWLLAQFRIQESRVAANGVGSLGFGTCPTPTATGSTSAGTIPAGTYVVRAVALSLDGFLRASVANGVVQTYSRNNNDGSSNTLNGGSSIASAASAGVTLASAGQIAWKVPAVPGAAAYAIYLGTTAGNAALAVISTANTGTLTAVAAGTQLAANITTDCSADPLVYDGLATQFAQNSSGSYFKSLDGAGFTAGQGGTINELNVAFEYLWNNYRIRPTDLNCGGNTRVAISNAIFGSTGPVYTTYINAESGPGIDAGKLVTSVMNPVTGDRVKIHVDPWYPNNQMMMFSKDLPEYSIPEVPLPFNICTRMRDYYQIIWPETTRTRYNGIYYSGMMQVRVPFSGAIIVNTP